MDPVQPYEHLCYVRCTYCNIIRIPCKRMLETVTVKCGQCCNLSYLTAVPPPPVQSPSLDSSATLQRLQKKKKNKQLHCSSPKHESSSSSSNAPFVVKPPERKHRPPSAYNRFMREEIQRIKAANPNIPHRDAFSAASKNWARCSSITNMPLFTTISESSNNYFTINDQVL
ncbi:hypothetical protein DCAR_0832944 [Daucus carota subsp. sativus]|uniref:Uncharacterized protein n=1 Tax=Daucus carota subsp. sativus TaxID=79200 RepID=A0AAF0XV78_DAUCS|nr:hypothetical protein DCAR_0832944 [Daucus carota subsp. sativus]